MRDPSGEELLLRSKECVQLRERLDMNKDGGHVVLQNGFLKNFTMPPGRSPCHAF